MEENIPAASGQPTLLFWIRFQAEHRLEGLGRLPGGATTPVSARLHELVRPTEGMMKAETWPLSR